MTARAMFNAHGFGHVTIEMLAGEIGIARGNLWYHFKTKQDLIEAISAQFTADLLARAKIRPQGPDTVVEDFLSFLTAYSAELRDYRFLYRDQADYGEHNERFLAEIPTLYEETRQQFLEFYRALIAAGHMDFPQNRLADLATNSAIILRFGLEYLREIGQATGAETCAVKLAVRQYLSLFLHTLSPDVAARVEAVFG